MDVSDNTIAVWSGRRVEVYNISDHGLQTVSGIDLNTLSVALYKSTLYAAVDGALVLLNLQVGPMWPLWPSLLT